MRGAVDELADYLFSPKRNDRVLNAKFAVPSLRAVIDIQKVASDMLHAQKEVSAGRARINHAID